MSDIKLTQEVDVYARMEVFDWIKMYSINHNPYVLIYLCSGADEYQWRLFFVQSKCFQSNNIS